MPDSRMPLVIRTTGDGLRKRRLEIGLTQAQVAEILGVAEATVGNWETVKQRPSERFLPRIASFLGSERARANSTCDTGAQRSPAQRECCRDAGECLPSGKRGAVLTKTVL